MAIWLDVHTSLFKGWKSLKNLNVGVFETDFKQVQLVFRQTTCTYSESWGPVEKFQAVEQIRKVTQMYSIFNREISLNAGVRYVNHS